MSSQVKEKLPLKLKLKAWWEGYDPSDVEAAFLARHANDEGDEPPAEAKDGEPSLPSPSEFVEASAEEQPVEQVDLWDSKRVDIAQFIWGEGYCGPGGTSHIVAMSKLLALTPEMSMLELGSRLGGPTRTLASEFGAWVTGYEESETLTAAANELSKKAGLSEKAKVVHYNPEEIGEFERKFDRALARESLFRIRNKQNVLQVAFNSMKPSALMLIVDYVKGREGVESDPDFQAWIEAEKGAAHPVNEGVLRDQVEEAGFNIRVFEDQSEHYADLITKAWTGAEDVVAQLANEEDGPAMIDTLLREAEYWTKRNKLLKNGSLKVMRVLGYKKDDPGALR